MPFFQDDSNVEKEPNVGSDGQIFSHDLVQLTTDTQSDTEKVGTVG